MFLRKAIEALSGKHRWAALQIKRAYNGLPFSIQMQVKRRKYESKTRFVHCGRAAMIFLFVVCYLYAYLNLSDGDLNAHPGWYINVPTPAVTSSIKLNEATCIANNEPTTLKITGDVALVRILKLLYTCFTGSIFFCLTGSKKYDSASVGRKGHFPLQNGWPNG